jgi:hypothetical protein
MTTNVGSTPPPGPSNVARPDVDSIASITIEAAEGYDGPIGSEYFLFTETYHC